MADWALGINLTILGMGTVFLVLAVLAIAMVVLNRIYDRVAGNRKVSPEAATLQEGGVTIVRRERTPSQIQSSEEVRSLDQMRGSLVNDELNPGLVAAITAAIAVMLEKPACEIKLTTVRRTTGVEGSWVQFGRIGVINSRISFYDRKGSR